MSPDGTDPGDAHAVTGKESRITGKARSCGSTTNVFRAGGTGQVLSSYDAKNAMEAGAEGQSTLVGTGDSDVVGKGDVDKGGRHDVCNRGYMQREASSEARIRGRAFIEGEPSVSVAAARGIVYR